MYFLPEEQYIREKNACYEKIQTYQKLSDIGLPILKSVILPYNELDKIGKKEESLIKRHLGSNVCMIRYIYKTTCCRVKNGGKLIPILSSAIYNEKELNADLWLLEPSDRNDNLYCFNISLNHTLDNLHIEILGEGFDVSDLNKGKISPHEYIDVPYPIHYGIYHDWWKWAKFYFCSQLKYEESIILRKKRIKEFKTSYNTFFPSTFHPVDERFLEKIFFYIDIVEEKGKYNHVDFYNISCSYEKSGRIIFWDIQTPNGKQNAYWG